MKVSAEYIQVMTVRKQEMFFGLSAVTNDICHMSDVEDISISQNDRALDQPYEFTYKCLKENTLCTFNSPKREAIVNVSFLKLRLKHIFIISS